MYVCFCDQVSNILASYVADDDLELILPPLPPKFLENRPAPPYTIYTVLAVNPCLYACSANTLPTDLHPWPSFLLIN